ncbi:hypothetical protein ONZ45_g8312 [Pleurotus djamor]|nr:hypothetical protein ONZ45_g8312 [Pleurotus djamor]
MTPQSLKQPDPLAMLQGMTFIGTLSINGLMDPLKSATAAKLHRAGISVKLSSSHSVSNAQVHPATTPVNVNPLQVIRGPEYRTLPFRQRLSIASRLDILSHASSDETQILACDLISLGHTVCKAGITQFVSDANVSVSPSSLETLILWSRHARDVTRQLIQYQMISGITLIGLLCVTLGLVVMSPFHFMWSSLVLQASSFTLSQSQPLPSLWDSPPDLQSTSTLFTVHMINQVAAQSCYQVTTVALVRIYGYKLVGVEEVEGPDVTFLQTLAFNTLVFCFLFSALNSRATQSRINIFEGISEEFILILILSTLLLKVCEGAGFQVILIEYIQPTDLVAPLTARGWCASVLLGMCVIPIGLITRKLPHLAQALRIVGALAHQGPLYSLVASVDSFQSDVPFPPPSPSVDLSSLNNEGYLYFLEDSATTVTTSQSSTLFPYTTGRFGGTEGLTVSSISSFGVQSDPCADRSKYLYEVPRPSDDQIHDPLIAYNSLGARLTEMVQALRNTLRSSPPDASVSLASISILSQPTPDSYPNTTSSPTFYSIDTGSSVSTSSELYESFTSDGTFYTATEYPTIPSPSSSRSAPPTLPAAILSDSRKDVQINLINIHIHGDTYNGEINGGYVGGRGSRVTVADHRVQLEDSEAIQIINANTFLSGGMSH